MVCILFVMARGRKRVRCLEAEISRVKLEKKDAKPVETYQENRLVKIIELVREQEARMQSRAILMELLIEDADDRIAKMSGGTSTPSTLQTPSFKKDFLSYVDKGMSNEDIARRIHKQPWVVELLKDLWIKEDS